MAECDLSYSYFRRSESIVTRLCNLIEQYPNTLRILNHNRNSTIEFLQAKDFVMAFKLNLDKKI